MDSLLVGQPDAGTRWIEAMRRGDFSAAWAINDAVLARGGGLPDDPRLPYHLRFVWDGRPFDGRNVLVRCYHGLGDTLQFARYLPALRHRAASVALEVQPELFPLLRSIPEADRVIPFQVDAPAPPSACDLEIMELPHALRLGPETPPYLSVPPDQVHRACERLGGGPIIGICSQAGDWDPERSVPLATLAPALQNPGWRFIRLQRSPCPGLPPGLCWTNPDDPLDDMLDTAALVAAADLIVTVDTMIAHLAGAMGRPVWLLLKAEADWRWMNGRRDSPWYPTMRLFRQSHPGDWSVPVANLAMELAAFVGFGHGPSAQHVAREPPPFTPSWDRSRLS
ncbi:MAG TPA: hypothetical protein VIZ17_13310 [Acetobacteraceae bacterium]